MSIATFKRYEKKYLITSEQLNNLTPFLLKHMSYDEHCINGKEYTIYNVYYDTDNNDVIRSCSDGLPYKEKMRMRSYYPTNNLQDYVFLEIKKKKNGIGNKRRIKIKLGELDNFVENGISPNFNSYLSQQVAKELQYYIKTNNVHKKCYIQYDRLAFFDKDNKDFRMTFDRNIRTRRDNFQLGESESDKLLLPDNIYIMEVKILGAMPLWLTEKLSEMELYSQGYSKYGKEWLKQISKKDDFIKNVS